MFDKSRMVLDSTWCTYEYLNLICISLLHTQLQIHKLHTQTITGAQFPRLLTFPWRSSSGAFWRGRGPGGQVQEQVQVPSS